MVRKQRTRKKNKQGAGYEAELELRDHFDGQRSHDRIQMSLPVTLSNLEERFCARTIDVSCAGALFQLTDEAFAQATSDLFDYCQQIREYFPDGLLAIFGNGAVCSRMDVVRATVGGLGGTEAPLLACRFVRTLSEAECGKLGLPVGAPAAAPNR